MNISIKKILSGVALFSVITPLSALEFELNAEVQAAFESNALQAPIDEQDDLGLTYGLNLDIEHREASWDVGGNYQYAYIDYREDTNDDQTLFVGSSDVIWRIKPSLLEWSFSHSRQNERRTALDQDILNNREVRQVITTQPVMYFRLGSGDQIITSLRYVDVDQENANDNNSQRYGGAVGWRRALTSVSTFSINTEYSNVDFEALDADYELTRLFFDYTADLRVLDYTLQLGASNIEPDIGDGITAEFIRVNLSLEQTVHTYTLSVVDELTDTSIAIADVNFALNIDNRGTQNINVFDAADLLTQKQAIFGYTGNILCRSCIVAATLGYVELDYETADRLERNSIATASLGYAFTPNLNITFGVNYQENKLLGADLGLPIDDNESLAIKETGYTLTFEWQVFRRMQLSLAYAHDESSSPILPVGLPPADNFNLNFDNDTILMALSYRLW
ncbi:MAG: hypothetical protein AB8B86_11025 [Pseudomonadales bacterium]